MEKVAEEKLTPLESWDRYEEFEENLKKYKLIARKQMKEANWPKNRWSNEYMRLHNTEEPVKPKKGSDILEEMIKPVEKPVKSCITEPEYDYDIEKLEEMFRNQETDDWSFDD
ncbi:unnamed protein product [Caenorhabditis angaria]|uniref:Uncharacterized protein n=1 Tax=Caenorhabditis angaria TaxID=860376 RepID=A0A9P1MX79_9PELO|nr:unnamed protein product [Caenorhabditis angaria]